MAPLTQGSGYALEDGLDEVCVFLLAHLGCNSCDGSGREVKVTIFGGEERRRIKPQTGRLRRLQNVRAAF